MLHPAHSSRLKLQGESTWTRRTHLQRRHRRPGLEALECRALLSTLTVMNTADSGSGSLRAEIGAAHSGDTIDFSSKLKGRVITLTSGELVVNKSLNPGARCEATGRQRRREQPAPGYQRRSHSHESPDWRYRRHREPAAASERSRFNSRDHPEHAQRQRSLRRPSGNALGGAIFNAAGAKLSIIQSLLTGNRPTARTRALEAPSTTRAARRSRARRSRATTLWAA